MKVTFSSYIINVFLSFILFWGPAQSIAGDFLSADLSERYALIVEEMVNHMRVEPLGYASFMGLDTEEIQNLYAQKGLSHILEGVPPLVQDPVLTQAAKEHFNDMIENLYFSHYDMQGKGPGDRLLSHGFQAVIWGEAMAGLAFSNVIDPDTALNLMFGELARSAFFLDGEGATLLDPQINKIGVFFSGGNMVIAGEAYNVYLLIIETAREVHHGGEGELGGRVYFDMNGDGVFQVDEAIPGCQIEFNGPIWTGFSPYKPSETYISTTSPSGNYYITMPNGEYEYKIDCATIGSQNGQLEVHGATIFDIKFEVNAPFYGQYE